jgi:hypothetical protein
LLPGYTPLNLLERCDAMVVKLGYRWKDGNEKSIRFWKNVWFGNIPLATQFWDIFIVVNQQTKTIEELWDGS